MSRNRDIAMFLSLAVLWGFSFPAISVGLESLPPLLFAAARYDIAAVLLLTAAAVRVEKWRPTARNDLAAVAGGGVFLIAGNGLLFLGQQTVPSGVAAILQGLVPILTALWAIPLLGERLSGLGPSAPRSASSASVWSSNPIRGTCWRATPARDCSSSGRSAASRSAAS